ncbi:NADP-dependent oxidoreductase [Marinobacterium nitratireducens]|uniref:NADP-dependent oxidoreductase n=1 Tax=Marinobacterium nitratireducens TaxID=518897 RepID=A0A918DX73_9GAMM|nr:NADP-dependent oxidoreductase [Marinobacterium nitratireducens]GGO88867.1 NADP-dependent oxidoreductase [Marinobacterium nitratireducens]
MSQSKLENRQMTLASRPVGAPGADNFAMKVGAVPEIIDGEVLLRTVYLSLDPYMRGRMSDAESYAEPVAIGEPMVGGTINRVVSSKHPGYSEGDWVLSYTVGWQDYGVSDGSMLFKLDPEMAPVSHALGVLGMPGFTAYMGLLDIGKPKSGETLVVAAATGPVGSTVAQIGKIKGCRVVAIAGGEEKRRRLEALGVDVALDHSAGDFAEQLAAACPDGIDVYYENVGGHVFDAVLPLLNTGARVPVCGLIAHYNDTALPDGPDRLSLLMSTILVKRMTVRGFIIFDDYGDRYPEFAGQMARWVAEGRIDYLEQVIDGLENAPDGLRGLLEGENFGKLVVRVGEDELA